MLRPNPETILAAAKRARSGVFIAVDTPRDPFQARVCAYQIKQIV